MAATAFSPVPSAPRKTTRGFSQIQNSLIENMALLTHAELVLLLAVSRRGNGCQISDSHWSNWTGLKPRQKDYAIEGLKSKGLQVSGRGAGMRFSIQWSEWQSYVLKATPPEVQKPRTKGRAVAAPPGTKIHEECVSKGCQRLCEENASCDANNRQTEGEKFVQPVAQTVVRIDTLRPPANAQPVAQTAPADRSRTHEENQQDKLRFVQPVAQTQTFPKTLAAIRKRFPTAGEELLEQLAEKIRSLCPSMPPDDVLAGMIPRATAKTQHSPGLYLRNLPNLVIEWSQSHPAAGSAFDPSALEAMSRDLKAFASKTAEGRPLVKEALKTIESIEWFQLDAADRQARLQALARPILDLAVKCFRARPGWSDYWRDLVSITAGDPPAQVDATRDAMVQVQAATDAGLLSLL